MLYTQIFDSRGKQRYSAEFVHCWWESLSYGPVADLFSYDAFLAYCMADR